MRNNENGNSRSGRSAAAVRLVLLALIFVTVFAVVLSCGTGTETPLFGAVTDNVAEAALDEGTTTPLSSYQNSSVPLSEVQEKIHSEVNATYTKTSSLSEVLFRDYTSWYRTGGMGDGTGTGEGRFDFTANGTLSGGSGDTATKGGWGARTESSVWYRPGVLVAINVAIPSYITSLVDAGFVVTVNYTAKVYTTDYTTNNYYGMKASSAVQKASGYIAGDDVNQGGGTGSNGNWKNGETLDFGTVTLTGNDAYLNIYIAKQSSTTNQQIGIWVSGGGTLTFTVKRPATSADSTAPYISNAAAENGGILKTTGGASVPATDTYLGPADEGLEQGTTNITLSRVVGKATFSANGQNYYKKLTLTVRDGDNNSAAFYDGVRNLNITAAPGGVSGAWAHVTNLPQGNTDNEATSASGTNYYIVASATTNAASQATFTLYFKANGIYKIRFEDNGSAFRGNNDASGEITITVSGIDTTAPTATDLLNGSLTKGVFADTNFEVGTWASVGQVSQSLKGMAESSTDTGWAFFFDIAYSFYAPTQEWAESTRDSVYARNKATIEEGKAAPFKVVSGTGAANFSYNFKEGGASVGSPLSGVSPTGAGYYMIMIYIADIAGNVCATPFTYFVRVDDASITGTPVGEYSYLDKAGETQQVTTDQWINKYMIGNSARIDISFILNPAGNVVNFNFSSFAGTNAGSNTLYSAAVKPGTTADGEKLTATIGDIEFATDTEGATPIVTGLGAVLSAEIEIKVSEDGKTGDGKTRTATLSLIYTRVDGEFGVNSEPGVTVRSARSASLYTALPATVPSKW